MTRRFDEMLAWYKEVFEASVQCENPAFAFLTYDDEHHRFAFVNMDVLHPGGGPAEMPPGIGVNHVGYTFANVGELLETYDRLKRVGIEPYWRVHHGVTLSVYYRDPDGNRMEFQVDALPDAAAANAYMKSDDFAANPVGVEVDADALLARYRSGAAAGSLLAQPVGPASPIPPEHGLSS
jgi:catechol-2,3-dioxygenase